MISTTAKVLGSAATELAAMSRQAWSQRRGGRLATAPLISPRAARRQLPWLHS
jgi:hypothetical protein